MNIIDKFKAPINKQDLISVIRQAVFMSVIGGLLVGAIHLFITQVFQLSLLWMLLFVFGLYLARRIKNAYGTYHILYAVIGILAIFVTYYLVNIVYLTGFLYMIDALSTSSLSYISNPLAYFTFLNVFKSGFFEITNILNVIFFILVNVYVVRYLK
ncbi:MAG: hypothetical protein CVV58_03515 [Tenericutes bacterium HGW-Tenericutes-3]|nr:MAG: hypothetical protein CVV58_03515 [Tenericutes bacterium HGW-Tenericutes-3]